MVGNVELNTSAYQRTNMRRIAADRKVVRCLFPVDNIKEQAQDDNFANRLKEEYARDSIEMSKKYNFDFEKEVALVGRYQWSKFDGEKFVEMVPQSENIEPKDKVVSMQLENESTPKSVKSNAVPRFRKRLRSESDGRFGCESVKRKISYD